MSLFLLFKYMQNPNVKIDSKISTQNGIVSLRTDGILTFKPHKGVEIISTESMKEDLDAFIKLTDNKKIPFLSDNRTLNDFTSDQKSYMQEKIPVFCSKFAILIDGGISVFFFNMFQLFYKPDVIVKAFKNKESAINWLKEK